MKTISAFFLFALLSVCAAREWIDYSSSVPIPGQVHTLHRGWEGEQRTREYDFGSCRYTVVDRDALLEKFFGLFGADAPELGGIAEGNRVTLWTSLVSGRSTPVRRVPIVTTIVPLLFLLLLLAEGRFPAAKIRRWTDVRVLPDGSTEARRERHRCLGCTFIDILVHLATFASLLLIAWGVAAPFLEGEQTLREGAALATLVLLAVPVISVIARFERVPSVRWNESTLWIQGVAFKRADIREVVLRKGILEITRHGSRWKRYFTQEAAWTGAQLEKLGTAVSET